MPFILHHYLTKVYKNIKIFKIVNMSKEGISEHISADELAGDTLTKEKKPDGKKVTPEQIERENERLKAKQYTVEQDNIRLRAMLEEAQAEKRKPGLTVVDEDGNQKKRKRPNTWGLSDMIMPPFTKGRVAIYRILGLDGLNPATGLPVEPTFTLVPGEYTLYDKFDADPLARDKPVRNVIRTERKVGKNGDVELVPVIEDVVFERGWLQVPVESSYSLYVFMELHPNNVSNRHRPNNIPGIFERVDINYKSAASLGATLDLGIDAANEVTDMSKEDVLAYAAAVPAPATIITAGRPIGEIRHDLKRWVLNNPIPYYKLNKNAEAAIKMNVIDALNYGLIGYRPDVKGYADLETDEIICVHTAAQEPMEKLVKFLGSDEKTAKGATGKEWYKQILERMNYWS